MSKIIRERRVKATFGKCPKESSFFPEEDFPYWVSLGLNTTQDNPVKKKLSSPSKPNWVQIQPWMTILGLDWAEHLANKCSMQLADMSRAFTKSPLLQESRLTGGGSPNRVDLVERKVPVERKMGAANSFHWFSPWLYTCVVQTADTNRFCAAVAPTIICAGLSSLRGHGQWESRHTSAL